MHTSALFGIAIGLAGIGFALHGLANGTITFVFARLFQGWGPTLQAEYDREQSPVGFWASVAVYGLGGVLMAAGAAGALLR
jgi:hypothetical protein